MTRPDPQPPVRLRALHWSDLPEVAALETEVFPDDAWDLRSWWAELAQRPRRHYVVATAPELLGYAGLDLGHDTADVMTMAVAPQARGRGVGRLLLRHLLQAAAGAGATRVLLEVRADNTGALALYRAQGFTQVRVRRGYYRPGDVDALVLSRPVGGPG